MTKLRDPDGPDDGTMPIAPGRLPSAYRHSSLLHSRRPADHLDPDDHLPRRPAPASPAHPAGIHDLPLWEVPAREMHSWPPGAASGQNFRWDFERYGWQAQGAAVAVPRPSRRLVMVRELVETLLLALLIFLTVRVSLQNFRVEGTSMYTSLDDGEYLIVNKLSYATIDLRMFNFLPFFDAGDNPVKHLWGKPERGDVIVFIAPPNPERDYIKRIIGVPGDTVEIDGQGHVSVNGAVLEEPYITGTTRCSEGEECTKVIAEAGTPESRAECGSDACYFVMGDNRQNSQDSRYGWLVPEQNIVGKTLVVYWDHGLKLDLAPNHSVSAANGD